MSMLSSAGQMQKLGHNLLNSVTILYVRFSQQQDLLSCFFIRQKKNILLLLGMFFLLVCAESIFEIILKFLEKWKILEQSMFVTTFKIFQLD